nr:hypothetical protein Iba_chr14cCG2550 [Ipomoea batatas]
MEMLDFVEWCNLMMFSTDWKICRRSLQRFQFRNSILHYESHGQAPANVDIQLLSPRPTVIKRFSSISVGTSAFFRLLKLFVKAEAVAVSLYAGRDGRTGVLCPPLEEEEAALYSFAKENAFAKRSRRPKNKKERNGLSMLQLKSSMLDYWVYEVTASRYCYGFSCDEKQKK